MYCINCGTQLKETTMFCTDCGASQTPASSVAKESNGDVSAWGVDMDAVLYQKKEPHFIDLYLKDAEDILKKFFSRTPLSAISEAINKKSAVWAVFALLNMVLFSLVSGHTAVQLIHYVAQVSTEAFWGSATGAMSLLAHELFWYFFILGAVVFVAAFAGVHVLMICRRKKVNSFFPALHAVATAGLPITLALAVNLLAGRISWLLAVCILISAIIFAMMFLFEGVRVLTESESFSISLWEFSLFVLWICFVTGFALRFLMGYALGA